MGFFSRVNWAILVGVGVLTVGLGTPAAVWQNQKNVEQFLATKFQAKLNNFGHSWAEVRVEGRDVFASGLATSNEQIASANDILQNMFEARSAVLDAALAPKLEPFSLTLTKSEKNRSMIGGMPNEELAEQAKTWFGEGQVELQLASGSPPARDWRDVTQFAIRLFQHFDEGSVAVEGLKVSIDGRAKDHEAFHTLDVVFGAGFPDNLERGDGNIVAPLVSPYEFTAEKQISAPMILSGNVVSKDQLADLKQSGAIVDALKVSSGEPSGFSDVLSKALQALSALQHGQFEISDNSIKLAGKADDFATFDEILSLENQLKPFKVALQLERPTIKPFTIKFELVDDRLSVVGYVPSDKELEFLATLGADGGANEVRIANGAPEKFDQAMDLLVAAIKHLQAGATAEIEDQQITVQGKAISPQDFLALQEKFGHNIPDGYDLVVANIELPDVTPYSWSLNKEPEGRVRLAGYSPSSELNESIFGLLPSGQFVDDTLPAIGQPADFEKIVLASAAASNQMAHGKISLQNDIWHLDAAIKNKQQKNSLLQEFSDKQIQLETWQAQFTVLPPPVANPYRFEATRAENGELTFDGFVRNEEMQLLLSGMGLSNVSLASGEPEGFDETANIGISALQRLETGQFGFDGQNWFLTGVAAHQDDVALIRNDLGDLANVENGWRIEIEARIVPIVPYLWSAEKSNEGDVIVSGYVPDDATLAKYSEQAGDLKVGFGAPDGFAARAEAALQSLGLLQAGRASLSGDVWTLMGSAQSDDAIAQITKVLAPFGSSFRLDLHVVLPIEQLTLNAKKDANGQITYAGFLADKTVWSEQNGRLQLIGDQPGDRQDFLARTGRGLGALDLLVEGVLTFDGEGWTLDGLAADKAVMSVVMQMLVLDQEPSWKLSLVDAEEKARLEAEAKAKAEEQARLAAEAEAKAKAKAEAEEKAKLEAAEKERAAAEEKARLEAEAEAKAEEQARLAAEVEAKAKAQAEEQAKLEAAEKEKAAAEEKARLEAEAKAKAEEQARLAAEAEAKAKAEAEAEEKAKLEAAEKEKAATEEKARLEAEAKAKAEAEEQARLEAAAQAKAESANKFTWRATKSEREISLAGNVPDASARYGLQLALGLSETPELTIALGAPERFSASAFAGLEALKALEQGAISLENGNWQISGSAKDFRSRDGALAALKTSPDPWKTDITTPPGWVICGEVIGDLLKQETIAFQSGSTNLNETSKQVLLEVATQLNLCPNAIVEVEGHTDGDGAADANLTLSVIRAERVVDELIELGVDATRLFAVGYGETLPIASNETQNGKRLNRRIVFAVRGAVE